MTSPRDKPPLRYITVSLRPETHRRLLGLLRPRETMDQLVARIIRCYLLRQAAETATKEATP